jgi:hypothetical protein
MSINTIDDGKDGKQLLIHRYRELFDDHRKLTEVVSRRRSACLVAGTVINHGAIKLNGLFFTPAWSIIERLSKLPVVASVVLVLQRHTKWFKQK